QAWAIQQKLPHWQTMTFTVLCFAQLGNAIAIRSRRESVFSMGLLANKPMLGAIALTVALQLMVIYVPFFNDLFNTQPLTWAELGITIGVSSVVFWAVEIQKLVSRQRDREQIVGESVTN
ncbi:MAG: ATPase, partial [Bacteroidetes bacterium]